jgi:hypothetical protein
MPVVRPEAYLRQPIQMERVGQEKVTPYNDKTACTDMYRAGTLKVSKRICAADSLLVRGFSGASVSSTGCWT